MIFVAVDRFSRLFSIHAQSIPWSLEVHVKEELRVRHRTSVLRASRKPRYESITKIRQQTGTRFKLGPLASNWEDRRVTGVIGVPCDRDDGLIVHAGGVAARGFHRPIVREDYDLRGREPGAIAQLLCGVARNEAPQTERRVMLDVTETLQYAVKSMQHGEVIVVFYEKLEPLRRVVEVYSAQPVQSIAGEGGVEHEPDRVGRRVGRRFGRQQGRVEREAVRNARAPKARAEGSRDIAASNMSRLKRPSAEGASRR